MAYKRVRIYDGHEPGTNVIGLSSGASDLPENPDFIKFMHRAGYQWQETTAPVGSVSYRHVEVRPPFSLAATIELGIVCVGGTVEIPGGERVRYSGAIDGGNDGVLVLENRTTLPDGALGGADYVIARGS